MIRIAYLISAHTDPKHLQRLVSALDDGLAHYFIHIDGKVDDKPFRTLLPPDERIHYVVPRIKTLWGDITQVYYQCSLLRAAVNFSLSFDRICTLSGLDFPLLSPLQINAFFAAQPHKEFIQGICLTDQNESVTRLYRIYRPQTRVPWLSVKLNNKVRKMHRLLLYAFGKRKKLYTPDGKKLYKGADWWAITPALAREMLRMLDNDARLLSYFSTLFAPSEVVWQTLVFNSSYSANAMLSTGNYVSLAQLTPLHHIDYSTNIAVFTLKDWDKLMDSGKLFCRKTMTGVSDDLMTQLEKLHRTQDACLTANNVLESKA